MCKTYGMDLTEDEKDKIVKAWRQSNPAIVKLWRIVERLFKNAIMGYPHPQEPKRAGIHGKLGFHKDFIVLPSGRSLCYPKARQPEDSIVFQTQVANGLMIWSETYGGKLVENIVQGIARDVLAEAMLNLDALGYKIVAHIHDEVIVEVPKGEGTVEEVNEIMTIGAEWMSDLPLAAEGFKCEYYKKG
jgi:DNA polymerase